MQAHLTQSHLNKARFPRSLMDEHSLASERLCKIDWHKSHTSVCMCVCVCVAETAVGTGVGDSIARLSFANFVAAGDIFLIKIVVRNWSRM